MDEFYTNLGPHLKDFCKNKNIVGYKSLFAKLYELKLRSSRKLSEIKEKTSYPLFYLL
jgi:hypothetical protein